MSLERTASRTAAELADLCFDFLTANPDELMLFMQASGYAPDRLRQAIGTDALGRGLIEYFASSESLLLALCKAASLKPEAFMRVYHALNRSD